MSVVTRLRCDGCNREVAWFEGYNRDTVPEGWHYWMRREEDGADDAHLCSWDCLVMWVHRRRPVRHDRVPVTFFPQTLISQPASEAADVITRTGA